MWNLQVILHKITLNTSNNNKINFFFMVFPSYIVTTIIVPVGQDDEKRLFVSCGWIYKDVDFFANCQKWTGCRFSRSMER